MINLIKWIILIAAPIFVFVSYKNFCRSFPTINAGNRLIDKMDSIEDGIEFEKYCASVLIFLGFSNVKVTKASNDYGIDVLAEKEGISYAIQSKFYSSPVGNSAVQEASSGMLFYKCNRAIVMTNSRFTKNAIILANSIGVELWDGESIRSAIKKRSKQRKPSVSYVNSISSKKINQKTEVPQKTSKKASASSNNTAIESETKQISYLDVIQLALKCGHLTVPLVCGALKVNEEIAQRFIDDLVIADFLSHEEGSPLYKLNPRKETILSAKNKMQNNN